MQHFASRSSLIFLILLSAEVYAEEATTIVYTRGRSADSCSSPDSPDSLRTRQLTLLTPSSLCCTSSDCRGWFLSDYHEAEKLSATCQDGKVAWTYQGCSKADCSECTFSKTSRRDWYSSENMDKYLAGECHVFNFSSSHPLGHVLDGEGWVIYGKVTEVTPIFNTMNKLVNVCAPSSENPALSACKKTTTSSAVGFIFSSVLAFRTLVISAIV